MKRIISIDPSLRSTGVYCVGKLYTIATPAEKGINNTNEALENILFDIRSFVIGHKPDLCLIEDYAHGARGNAVTTIAEVKGIIKSVMFDSGIPVIVVNISVWKDVMAFNMPKKGKGWRRNYLKRGTNKAGGALEFSSPDEVDAFLIYRAVMAIVNVGPRTDGQRNLLQEVKKWL